jgi:hypothetical protein
MDYFSDDDTSTVIGGLSIENGKAGVLIHGSTVIGRDRHPWPILWRSERRSTG